jgi:PAS domain S-box-containing protein
MALKLFGAETPDQLLGQPVIDRFDPRRQDIVKERIRVINEEKRSVNMLEEICLRLDGTPFHAEVSAGPVKWGEHDGALVFFRDITKRLELEERLRHNQIMLARTERIAQIGSWEWEVATDSVTWSDELFRIFQLDPTRGAPSFEEQSSIYTPDSMARLREAVGLALSDSIPYELELQGIRADGETRHLRARGFPERGPDGRASYLFGSLNDITDRKRLEEERLEMERKIVHAQKLESLAVMAGGIAHDFNNQLAVVLGNLELALTDQTLEPETLLSIESAIGAAQRSAELSRQMQVYTGNIVYFPVDLDLNEVLNRNLAQLKSTVSKYVALNFETNSTLPIVKGDADQIQRLVMNIIVNASEAIGDKDGDVTIRTGVMDCDEVYLSHSQLEEKPGPGRFVFLEVSDTGSGMDSETQRRLFDPFFSTKFWGRGLGMAEVIGIVKGHQGAIIVESEVGKGTTVRVLLPALGKAPDSSVKVMNLVETKAQAIETVNRRKTILVVEDEAGVRNLVVRRLGLLDYDSIIAEDGEEGVSVFRERMNEIDLVMLDFKMPKMNGVEAFGELIRIKPEVKIILSSGYTEDVVMESFPGQRPACVLHKPYDIETLRSELDRLLGTVD